LQQLKTLTVLIIEGNIWYYGFDRGIYPLYPSHGSGHGGD